MHKNLSKQTKQDWNRFLEKFSIENIKKWNRPENYALGYPDKDDSFCYWVEYKLKEIGEIRAANASKYGLYYGKYGKGSSKTLRATKQNFKGNVDEAFKKIKEDLIKLIQNAQDMKQYEDFDCVLSPLFKRKIMFLYNSKMMIPIFDEDDLHHFEDELGIGRSKSYVEGQRKLMTYKIEKHRNLDNYQFMSHLYNEYGKSDISSVVKANDEQDYLLNQYLNDLTRIDSSDASNQKTKITRVDERKVFSRSYKVALQALENANDKCEMKTSHPTFMRSKNDSRYLEVHHLVPMCYQDRKRFEGVNLDIPENVVALCSNCHNEIHYGRNKNVLIKKLYKNRKTLLARKGINITESELLEMYRRIASKKDL